MVAHICRQFEGTLPGLAAEANSFTANDAKTKPVAQLTPKQRQCVLLRQRPSGAAKSQFLWEKASSVSGNSNNARLSCLRLTHDLVFERLRANGAQELSLEAWR
jgi:hypothetical protein